MPRRSSSALFYFLFVVTGIGVMLLSILLPYVHHTLTDAQIGRLLAVQFTGQLFGALFVTRRILYSLLAGLVLVFCCSCWLALGDGMTPTALLLYGAGMGVTMTATNIAVGMESAAEDRVARLELLNAFWPLGAMSAPLLARPVIGYGRSLYLVIALLSLAGGLWLLVRGLKDSDASEPPEATTGSLWQLVRFCLLGFFAVGVDTSISNWMAVSGSRFFPGTGAITLAPSLFWSGILLGRALTSRTAHRMNWRAIVLWSSMLCGLAIAAAALSTAAWMFLTAIFAAALFVAPLYPAVLAQSVMLRGKNLIFFAAGIGSALVPWLVGELSTFSGSLRFGIALPAVLTIAAMLLAISPVRKKSCGHP